MNKQNKKNKKTDIQNGSIAIPRRAASADCQPIPFAQQLLAAPLTSPAFAPGFWLLARISNQFTQTIQQLAKQLLKRRNRRRKLDVVEIQQLGEKRFIGIIRVGKQKFLIGGAATSVSLLAEINSHSASVSAARPLGREIA